MKTIEPQKKDPLRNFLLLIKRFEVFKGLSKGKTQSQKRRKMKFTWPIGIGIERTKTQKP